MIDPQVEAEIELAGVATVRHMPVDYDVARSEAVCACGARTPACGEPRPVSASQAPLCGRLQRAHAVASTILDGAR